MIRRAVLPAAVALALILPATAAAATTHVVTQSGFSFVPSSLIILEGDTVQWVQTGSTHTVTNGTGVADPNAGTLFDAPLDPGNPVFEYIFTQVGNHPYFCRPHEVFNMKGNVFVDAPTGSQSATWSGVKKLFGRPAAERPLNRRPVWGRPR